MHIKNLFAPDIFIGMEVNKFILKFLSEYLNP